MKPPFFPICYRHSAQGFARNIELLVLLTMLAMGIAMGMGGWKAGLLRGGAWPYILAGGLGALGFLFLPLFAALCMLVGKIISHFRK